MRGWWRDLADLVLPAECGGCGRARAVLCPRCRAALSGAAPRRVRPVPEPPGLPAVYAAARYADEVRAVLLAHKERGVLALAGPLGAALAGAVRAGLRDTARERAYGAGDTVRERAYGAGSAGRREAGAGAGAVLLVPVPSARRAVRARGHDPARRIALAAAGELRRSGTPARVLTALRQRRAVADQSGLDSRRRRDNLAGALVVAPGAGRLLRGAGAVVLVDDLMTTGASLAEAARAVRASAGGPEGTAGQDAAPWERTAGPDPHPAGPAAVYSRAMGEGRGERRDMAPEERTNRWPAAPERAGVDGVGEAVRRVTCAAVVASSPNPFEMNWN
ncbi:ComF family protein [Streptomyces sp. enrichment culture]|uniref:ComF family protein n=1 Tax=Streptomyces sp. enrichment culture TaxID=1795815 RepID=UPI003F544FB2